MLKTAYIVNEISKIRALGDNLVIERQGQADCILHLFKLNQVVIFGKAELTASARNLLMLKNIDVTFMSKSGKYLGRMENPYGKNIFLRQAQFLLLSDNNHALKLAKIIVKGKLKNYHSFLSRQSREHQDVHIKDIKSDIERLNMKIDRAKDINSVRGYEGMGSRLYFSVYKQIFNKDWGFTKRIRRPPTDPINSLLSLGYTLLANHIDAYIKITSLDPYMGFFHQPTYGRPSLTLDLMEEFRPLIVDTLILKILNLGMIRPDDFKIITDNDPTKDGGLRLHEEPLKKYLRLFEEKLNQKPLAYGYEEHLTYKSLIERQVQNFAKTLMDAQKEYVPLSVKL